MVLETLGMCRVASGDAWQAVMCKAWIWRRCAAFVALATNSFVAHATLTVLSHQHAMWVCARSANCSSTIYWRSSPVISRPEFVIHPWRLFWEMTCCCISMGNSTCHTMGRSFFMYAKPDSSCAVLWSIAVATKIGWGWYKIAAWSWCLGCHRQECHPVSNGLACGHVEACCLVLGFVARVAMIGKSSSLSFGMPMDVCMSLPLFFPNCQTTCEFCTKFVWVGL